MKALYACAKCIHELNDATQRDRVPVEEAPAPTRVQIEITDGEMILECPRHGPGPVLLGHKFELLFDLGALAILDGYYREAVSSFAACVERFYEFYFRIVFEAHELPEPEIKAAWKAMASQSERQLGAFVACHLLDAKEAPALLLDQAEFRNKIIHKGHFPSRIETVAYGEKVRDHICTHMIALDGRHSHALAAHWAADAWTAFLYHKTVAIPVHRHLICASQVSESGFGEIDLNGFLEVLPGLRDKQYWK